MTVIHVRQHLTIKIIQLFKCRLNGIDCAEMAPSLEHKNREEEIKNAIKARNTVIKLASNIDYINDKIGKKQIETLLDRNDKLIDVICFGFDKYGRLLVELVSDNININKYLVSNKLAKEYDGGTKIQLGGYVFLNHSISNGDSSVLCGRLILSVKKLLSKK